jgi:FkbM family methyltransferase
MPTIHSSRDLFGERPNAVYDVLGHLEPGLMLDVGAAAGSMTAMMLERSPESTVIAFEPFPGNHLEQRVGDDPRVTIVRAAVADAIAPARFFVASTVTGSEPGWERFAGYSSAGHIVDDDAATDDGRTIVVPTVRLDDRIGGRHVRFLKVDVQGGELGVLRSAARCLVDSRVDVMFVEFGGDWSLLSYILASGFDVFDSEYLVIADEPPDPQSWRTFRTGDLSVGRRYFRAWPLETPSDPRAYCAMFTERLAPRTALQTDLVCVRAGFVDRYLTAAARAAHGAG